MSKQPRRYDGRSGVKERNEQLGMLQMQAHCNEFFRSRGLPTREQFKPREEKPQ